MTQILFIMAMLLFGNLCQVYGSCDYPYQCSNRTITSSTIFYGYKAGYGNRFGINAITGSISAKGVYSIANSSLAVSGQGVTCEGDSACVGVTNMTQRNDSQYDYPIYSYVNGLHSSTISSSYNLQCLRYFSCANTIIHDSITIIASGPYSLENAIIYSKYSYKNEKNQMLIDLQGYYSGYNATIYCNTDSNSRCYVNCTDTACYGLNLRCSSENDDNKAVINCTNINGYTNNADDDLCYINSTATSASFCNYQIYCNPNISILCPNMDFFGDYLAANGIDINIFSNDRYFDELDIAPHELVFDSRDYADQKILNECDASLGLDFWNNLTTIDYNMTQLNSLNESNRTDTLVCFGEFGYICNNAVTFSDGEELIINNGHLCCLASDGQCTGIGYQYVLITNGDIICAGGRYVCQWFIELSTVNGNIYCSGHESCSPDHVLSANNGSIYCLSTFACIYSDIYNADTLICSGHSSCKGCNITNVTNIYGMIGVDELGFVDTKIRSGGGDDNPNSTNYMNVFLRSSGMSENSTIECNYGSICYIECLTKNACDATTQIVFCHNNSLCIIFCNPDMGIECPVIIVGYNETRLSAISPLLVNYQIVNATLTTTIDQMNITTQIQTLRQWFDDTIIPIAISNNLVTTITTTGASGVSGMYTDSTTPILTTQHVSTEKTNNDDVDNASVDSVSFEYGSYLCLGMALTLPIIVAFVAKNYAKNAAKEHNLKGLDGPNYFAIFMFFWNMGDLYSDLLFCGVLSFDMIEYGDQFHIYRYLFYGSLTFSVIPYMFSNVICLYHISRWQTTSVYMKKYTDRYDWIIIVISCVSGYYSAIELIRSKLFYLPMFSLELRQDEYAKIQQFRFFNTVILENLPQIVIQVLYCWEKGTVEIFVINAMLFSLLSSLISIFNQVSKYLKHNADMRAQYFYRAKKLYKMKIECSQFSKYHRYIHTCVANVICGVLGIDNLGNIEIYHIVAIRNGIVVHLDVSNVGLGDINTDSHVHTQDKIASSQSIYSKVVSIAQPGSKLNVAFKQELKDQLGWDSVVDDQDISIWITKDENQLAYDVSRVENITTTKKKVKKMQRMLQMQYVNAVSQENSIVVQ